MLVDHTQAFGWECLGAGDVLGMLREVVSDPFFDADCLYSFRNSIPVSVKMSIVFAHGIFILFYNCVVFFVIEDKSRTTFMAC